MIKSLRAKCFRNVVAQQWRTITALYVTGDKANQSFAPLQPHMDFSGTLSRRESLEFSINKRKLQIKLTDVKALYEEYNELKEQLKQIEKKRDSVASELKQLTHNGDEVTNDVNALKAAGKTLRNNYKELREQLYPIEDKFVHAFLNLPNELHISCPTENLEKVLYRSTTSCRQCGGQAHLEHESIDFVDNNRYYLLKDAAEFDVQCTHALCRYFVDAGNFQQTTNPDFVRCVLLEANATPVDSYHLVREEHMENNLNCAYLVGGGNFESYLGALTKLCVYPSVLPLRLVSSGRNYKVSCSESPNQRQNLYTATQTNAVQTFAAATTLAEADIQMEHILNLAVDFYKTLGIHFRVIYADSRVLNISECLRAVIEVYSPIEQRYVSVGHVSHYSDFVSRRILFCTREQKEYQFLHMVGGPVLYTSRLIAALIENGVALEDCRYLNVYGNQTQQSDALDEFKSIFK